MATNATEGNASEVHKFQMDSGMTSEQVFDFAFKAFMIPLLQTLGHEIGDGDFLETLQTAAIHVWAQDGLRYAESVSNNDMATWTSWLDDPDSPFHDRLTYEVIERTDSVLEIRVSECLWEETFREAGAPEIGNAVCCAGDFASCQAFNSKIHMTRTKTLMNGDECCNHRWEWKE